MKVKINKKGEVYAKGYNGFNTLVKTKIGKIVYEKVGSKKGYLIRFRRIYTNSFGSKALISLAKALEIWKKKNV